MYLRQRPFLDGCGDQDVCESTGVGEQLGTEAFGDIPEAQMMDPLLLGNHRVAVDRRDPQGDNVDKVIGLPTLLTLGVLTSA